MPRIATSILAFGYLLLGTYAVPGLRWSLLGVELPYIVPVLVIAGLMYLVEGGGAIALKTPQVFVAMVVFLMGTALASFTADLMVTAELAKALLFPLGLVVVRLVAISADASKTIVTCLAISGMGVFVYGVYGYITWNVGEYTEHTYNYFGVTYRVSTRNGDQLYFLTVVAIVVGFLLTPKMGPMGRLKKLAALLVLAAICLGVLLSYSRGAWLTLAGISCASLLLADRIQRWIILVGTAFVVAMAFAAGALLMSLGWGASDAGAVGALLARASSIYTLDEAGGGNSNYSRLELYKQAGELIVQNPGGIGVGAAGRFLVVDGEGFGNHAENSFLQAFLERGILGFAGFAYLLAFCLERTFRNARRKGAEMSDRAGFLICFTISFYGLFNNLIDSAWFWMCLGASIATIDSSQVRWASPNVGRMAP